LELARAGRYFDAHEELELAWRAAATEERDFYQGLVHVVVAWYQAGRGNSVGCSRQIDKAARRLAPYAPVHRSVAVSTLLADLANARKRVDAGSLDLAEPEGFKEPLHRDPQPPVAVEEEQQP
jgi:predicted metal-dependent hydrolase